MPEDTSLALRIAETLSLPVNVIYTGAGIYLALVLGTIARLTHLHRLPPDKAHSLKQRLATWWAITIVLSVVVALQKPAIVFFTGLVSVLAIREYMGLLPERDRFRRVLPWAYAAIPFQYLWIYLGWYEMFLIFVPVIISLLLTLRMVLTRNPDEFIHLVGELQWGMMLLVFMISHVASLLLLSSTTNDAGGNIGWFLYLVILTEFNDIAQALWGRPFGKHKIIPEVSPGKSWEGLLGAMVCTTILAVILAPVLTPLATSPPRFSEMATLPFYLSPWSIIAGVMVSLAGFFGDITMSSVKRDLNVKDSGTMLPGQGGILDRIDSLTFTAPAFFHFVRFLYG